MLESNCHRPPSSPEAPPSFRTPAARQTAEFLTLPESRCGLHFETLCYDASQLTNEKVHLQRVWKTHGLGDTSPVVTGHSATSEGWHVVVQAMGVGAREGEPGGKPLSWHVRCSPACSFRAS